MSSRSLENTPDTPAHDRPERAGTHIRSFVHRRAHITPAQQAALDQLLPRWSIPYQNKLLDFEDVFGRRADTILEIGFGMGETTEKSRWRAPMTTFGVEVFNAGVGALLRRIDKSGTNIRIVQHDAVRSPSRHDRPQLAGRGAYFLSRTWPKQHTKRRLIQPPFDSYVGPRLQPGLHPCATDWQNYAEQMLTCYPPNPCWPTPLTAYAPRVIAGP